MSIDKELYENPYKKISFFVEPYAFQEIVRKLSETFPYSMSTSNSAKITHNSFRLSGKYKFNLPPKTQ